MKEEYKRLELLESYISGKLKGNKKKEFEEQLDKDTMLKKDLDKMLVLQKVIRIKGRDELKNKLNIIHGKVIKDKKPKKVSNRSINEFINSLFDKYFSPYENLITVRSSKKEELQDSAMKAYGQGNYSEAVKLFKKILKDSQKNPSVLFYCGISLLELGKHNEAKNKFMKIIKLSDNPFTEKAEWYLGLSYLKGYNVDKAIKVFEGIDKDNSDYRTARNILNKLKDI